MKDNGGMGNADSLDLMGGEEGRTSAQGRSTEKWPEQGGATKQDALYR
jgi:hypothetical protein